MTKPRLFVDGYNLIFTLNRDRGSIEEARKELIQQLSKTSRPIVLVFDAPHFLRTHQGALEIVYADHSADRYILEVVEHTRGAKTVVTDDARLARQARHFGAHIQSPQDFLKWLARSSQQIPSEKPNRTDPSDYERWLRLFEEKREER